MFEILMYLFENYMDGSVALSADSQAVALELEQVGFHRNEIGRALDWLDGLTRVQELAENGPTVHGIRHYSPEESSYLNVEARGFLLYLEQLNILDPSTREVVIDRLMALEAQELGLGRIKWVVILALFNQPDKKVALSLLQDMMLAEASNILH
ncbi:MAG: DUF494 domain-containing protein [Gammaproteobacteria bacterium]